MGGLNGAERILIERQRQVDVEGFTAEHDDLHRDGVLAVIAAGLAVEGTDAEVKDPLERVVGREDQWDLLDNHRHNRIRQLEIAGALIAAELDRELRREGKP